jgi:uracil-DNA glycosylase family 4
VAALAMLKKNIAVAQDRGTIIKEAGRTYLVTYHPAAPLYSPKVRVELEKDFKKLKKLI